MIRRIGGATGMTYNRWSNPLPPDDPGPFLAHADMIIPRSSGAKLRSTNKVLSRCRHPMRPAVCRAGSKPVCLPRRSRDGSSRQ